MQPFAPVEVRLYTAGALMYLTVNEMEKVLKRREQRSLTALEALRKVCVRAKAFRSSVRSWYTRTSYALKNPTSRARIALGGDDLPEQVQFDASKYREVRQEVRNYLLITQQDKAIEHSIRERYFRGIPDGDWIRLVWSIMDELRQDAGDLAFGPWGYYIESCREDFD